MVEHFSAYRNCMSVEEENNFCFPPELFANAKSFFELQVLFSEFACCCSNPFFLASKLVHSVFVARTCTINIYLKKCLQTTFTDTNEVKLKIGWPADSPPADSTPADPPPGGLTTRLIHHLADASPGRLTTRLIHHLADAPHNSCLNSS